MLPKIAGGKIRKSPEVFPELFQFSTDFRELVYKIRKWQEYE
jgi:hypothetical protein